jgi:GNAT superfamily N-acetyltransferase
MTSQTRPLEAADYPSWRNLWDQYLVFYQTELPESQTQLTWQRLLDPNFPMFGLAAIIDEKLVGFGHYNFTLSSWEINPDCYLEDLFVDPGARSGGVGRSIIDAVAEAARAAGSDRMHWLTQRENEVARRLYDSYAQESGFVRYRIDLIKN